MAHSISQAIIAIDVGTGSCRAILIDDHLTIHTIDQIGYGLVENSPGRVEQDPEEVLRAAIEAIRRASANAKKVSLHVAGLCFSSAVSSLMVLDAGGKPVGKALTWADTRAGRQAQELRPQANALYRRTGTPLHASYWLPKLIWMRENMPETWEKAGRWMGIKDYIVWRLSGEAVTDYSNAAATGMLNLETLQWDDFACSLASISTDSFFPVYPTTYIIPEIDAEIALKLDLPRKTPLVLGAGDGVLANLGSGAVAPGQTSTTIGSSGACRTIASKPVLRDERMRTWSYPLLDSLWVIGGAENSGGLVVDWFLKTIFPPVGDPFLAMMAAAGSAPTGSDGLLFVPYLFGERAPVWDEAARGAFIGLNHLHTHAHMARAVLEGSVYALYDIFQVLEEIALPSTEIRVSGGYARSPFWLEVQANMFGRELTLLENHECSALGAGMLGFHALGLADFHSSASQLKVKRTIPFDHRQHAVYQRLIPLYGLAYQQLRPLFEGLQRLRMVDGQPPEKL